VTKKTKNLVVAAGVLALAVGAFVLTKAMAKDDESDLPTPVQTFQITTLDATSLRSVRIENPAGGVHVYSPDGENWLVADVSGLFTADVQRIMTTVRKFARLTSRELIAENPVAEDLAQFGLDSPEALVVLRDKDGTETIVEIGDASPSGAGRYVRTSGADRIFLVPNYAAGDAFAVPDDFRDRTLPSILPENLTRLEYRRDGVLFAMEPRTGEHPFINLASDFDVVSPFLGTYPASDYQLQKALGEETPLPSRIDGFRDELDPGDPALGLDAGTADMILAEDADGGVFHLIVGASDGEGGRYAILGDRMGPVFTLPDSDLGFLYADPFRFVEKFLFLGSIEKMSRMVVERGGESWTMTREDRGDPEDMKDDSYEVDGRGVPQREFSQVYQDFIGLMWEGRAEGTPSLGDPEVLITVYHEDAGVDPMVVRFWPYDDVYYLAAAGDAPREFVLGRYQVKKFLENLEALADG
jgi:hypothetical protein